MNLQHLHLFIRLNYINFYRFHDMKSGAVPREMVDDIRMLLIEAQELQYNIYNLAEGLEDQSLEEKLALDLISCQMRFDEIKKEVQLFENPVMR